MVENELAAIAKDDARKDDQVHKYFAPDALPVSGSGVDLIVCCAMVQHLRAAGDLETFMKEVTTVATVGTQFMFCYKMGGHDTLLTHTNLLYPSSDGGTVTLTISSLV